MNPRIIGINTLFMIPNEVGGTEYHLRACLARLERLDKRNSYVVFCNQENYRTFQFNCPRWKKVLCPVKASYRPKRILYEQCVLPFLIKKFHCDTLHSFGYFGPMICPAKHVITIHDVNWMDHPEDFTLMEQIAYRILIGINLITSYRIMSVSEFTKKRLIHHVPSIAKKIDVIPSSISDTFREEAKKMHVHPLKQRRYILCVSGMYPHKKIPYLLELWKEIAQRDKRLQLVLIGKNGKDEKKVKEMVIKLPRTHYYPKVSLPKLVSFYQHAGLCLFPSAYEGFGYPVYEAISVGNVVIVGKKHMYVRAIQKILFELSFNIRKDRTLVLSIFPNKKKKRKIIFSIDSYDESIKKLMNIYES